MCNIYYHWCYLTWLVYGDESLHQILLNNTHISIRFITDNYQQQHWFVFVNELNKVHKIETFLSSTKQYFKVDDILLWENNTNYNLDNILSKKHPFFTG